MLNFGDQAYLFAVGAVRHDISAEMFIDKYFDLFNCRRDVVAERFEYKDINNKLKPGYRLKCDNWKKYGVCPKSTTKEFKCDDCSQRLPTQFTDLLFEEHLKGSTILGMYPMLPGDKCSYVAGDFDNHDGNHDPFGDIIKVSDAFSSQGLPFYLLRSRSGEGFHGYLFFKEPVDAWKARMVYDHVLSLALPNHKVKGNSSFCSMYPHQDHLSQGKLVGNLIACPFAGQVMIDRNTIFLDPATNYTSHSNKQYDFMCNIQKITIEQLDDIISANQMNMPLRPISTGVQNKSKDHVAPNPIVVIPDGTRNVTTTSLIGKMIRGGFAEETIRAAMQEHNKQACQPPLEPEEVDKIVHNVYSRYASGATSFPPLTDYGNAERLVQAHGEDIRYCVKIKRWLTWNGKLWEFDDRGKIIRNAKSTVRTIDLEAQALSDHAARAAVYKHAKSSESIARIESMIGLAESEPGVVVMPNDLDADPMVINCENGLIDLKTCRVHPHDRNQLITKAMAVAYDPAALCPKWDAFLFKFMDGNLNMVKYLQRSVGYTLTGLVDEHVFFLLYGLGGNGKTTFSETIRMLMGDYAIQAAHDTFIVKMGSQTNDIAMLKGSRFVTVPEIGKLAVANEALIKQVTGGEPIQSRFLYSENFLHSPTYKLWWGTNHKPAFSSQDHGTWRRIHLIECKVKFDDVNRILGYHNQFKDELPGILRWAVEGCQEWLKSGLKPPQEVTGAVSSYKHSSDILNEFLEEKCDLGVGYLVKIKILYAAYVTWCEQNNVEPIRKRKLTETLEDRNVKSEKTLGEHHYINITLK